jgi:hypothetical protein
VEAKQVVSGHRVTRIPVVPKFIGRIAYGT